MGSKTGVQKKSSSVPSAASVQSLAVVRLLGLKGTSEALVAIEQEGPVRPARARIIGPVGRDAVGRQVAVMFENGDPKRPLVLGVVGPWPSPVGSASSPGGDPSTQDIEIDGERLLLTARGEIVLRCGKASLTLTRAGKVLLRGAYLSSRSSGVNRIKGGAVQIN